MRLSTARCDIYCVLSDTRRHDSNKQHWGNLQLFRLPRIVVSQTYGVWVSAAFGVALGLLLALLLGGIFRPNSSAYAGSLPSGEPPSPIELNEIREGLEVELAWSAQPTVRHASARVDPILERFFSLADNLRETVTQAKLAALRAGRVEMLPTAAVPVNFGVARRTPDVLLLRGPTVTDGKRTAVFTVLRRTDPLAYDALMHLHEIATNPETQRALRGYGKDAR